MAQETNNEPEFQKMEYPHYCQESNEWVDLTEPESENYRGDCEMNEKWDDDQLVRVCKFCYKRFY
jgi:hypothetical protein